MHLQGISLTVTVLTKERKTLETVYTHRKQKLQLSLYFNNRAILMFLRLNVQAAETRWKMISVLSLVRGSRSWWLWFGFQCAYVKWFNPWHASSLDYSFQENVFISTVFVKPKVPHLCSPYFMYIMHRISAIHEHDSTLHINTSFKHGKKRYWNMMNGRNTYHICITLPIT